MESIKFYSIQKNIQNLNANYSTTLDFIYSNLKIIGGGMDRLFLVFMIIGRLYHIISQFNIHVKIIFSISTFTKKKILILKFPKIFNFKIILNEI